MAEQPPAVEPEILPAEKPIPFKPRVYEKTAAPVESPPTSRADCEDVGGHGGPNGKRVYYPSGKLGKLLEEPLICEICGEVDV